MNASSECRHSMANVLEVTGRVGAGAASNIEGRKPRRKTYSQSSGDIVSVQRSQSITDASTRCIMHWQRALPATATRVGRFRALVAGDRAKPATGRTTFKKGASQ